MGEPAWLAAAGHALFTFCSYLLNFTITLFSFFSVKAGQHAFFLFLIVDSKTRLFLDFSILLRSLARRCRRSYRQKKPSIFAIRLWEGSWLVGHAPYLFSLVDLGGLLICVMLC
jgi:hypothetical protein